MMNVPRIRLRQLRAQHPADRQPGAACPTRSVFVNAGVSTSRSRTYSPTITSSADSRNGTRQPHAANDASSIVTDSTRNSAFARMKPIGAPSCGNVP